MLKLVRVTRASIIALPPLLVQMLPVWPGELTR